MNYIICHYSEIGLKGKNRAFFEKQLIENLKKALPKESFDLIKKISGRIIIKLKDKDIKKAEIKQSLQNVFGLAYFAFGLSCPQEIEAIKKEVLNLLKKENFKTFKISTKRSKKDFPLNSVQINQIVGEEIVKKLKKKVRLTNPDITCFIEIVDKFAFLYLEKIEGPKGLPVGTGGKAIALLSGGIDSPVAAFFILKRGVKIVFVHFHTFPYTSKASIEKAQKIVEALNKYQFSSRLYLVPFAKIQEEIVFKTREKLRVVLYRRMMLRIARALAKKEKALALVTGESIGQVASQTLENIRVIEKAGDLPILRPLIGLDKEEIIKTAKKIKTFDISILPHQDCCLRFVPTHPETKAKLKEVLLEEKKLKIQKLIKSALKNTEIKEISGRF
jgi:thiamine biosynthesis protein ThiI